MTDPRVPPPDAPGEQTALGETPIARDLASKDGAHGIAMSAAEGAGTSPSDTPKIQEQVVWAPEPGPELFIGLVGAIGTNLDRTVSLLEEALGRVDYTSVPIRLSHLLHNLPGNDHLAEPYKAVDKYYHEHITAGDAVRGRFASPDALAQIAVIEVIAKRDELNAKFDPPRSIDPRGIRRAYIFRQLKLPAEIDFLRSVYGQLFYCIAINADENARVESLSKKIAERYSESDTGLYCRRRVKTDPLSPF